MHKNRLVLTATAIVLFSAPLIAQGILGIDFNFKGAGARAQGMGGAFIGLADDATAISWNPAGLSTLERMEISAVTGYTMTSSTAEFQGESEELNSKVLYPNFGSVAIPLRFGSVKIVGAVAYQRHSDFTKENLRWQESRTSEKGSLNTITPGFSLQFHPIFSIGASVNIWLGNFESFIDEFASLSSLGSEERTTLDFSATNFTVGTLVDLEGLENGGIPLKIGASVKIPFELNSDFKYEFDGYDNFGNPEQTKAEGGLTFQIPLMLGFGLSYRLGDNFTVAADYEMRFFKDKLFILKDEDDRILNERVYSAANENLNQIRVGAEYLLGIKDVAIPLRAGFSTYPTLEANYDRSGTAVDQVSGITLSFGTGIIFSNIAIDLSMTMTNYDVSMESIQGTLDYKFKINTLFLSSIIYF